MEWNGWVGWEGVNALEMVLWAAALRFRGGGGIDSLSGASRLLFVDDRREKPPGGMAMVLV